MPRNRNGGSATKKRRKPRENRVSYPSLPRARLSRERLAQLEREAAARGIGPIDDYDKYLEEVGDFWPEEETCDEFIAWLRRARREGRY